VRGGDEALKKAKRRLKRKKEKEGKKAAGAGEYWGNEESRT
jgi:hypothetical protein